MPPLPLPLSLLLLLSARARDDDGFDAGVWKLARELRANAPSWSMCNVFFLSSRLAGSCVCVFIRNGSE